MNKDVRKLAFTENLCSRIFKNAPGLTWNLYICNKMKHIK